VIYGSVRAKIRVKVAQNWAVYTIPLHYVHFWPIFCKCKLLEISAVCLRQEI